MRGLAADVSCFGGGLALLPFYQIGTLMSYRPIDVLMFGTKDVVHSVSKALYLTRLHNLERYYTYNKNQHTATQELTELMEQSPFREPIVKPFSFYVVMDKGKPSANRERYVILNKFIKDFNLSFVITQNGKGFVFYHYELLFE